MNTLSVGSLIPLPRTRLSIMVGVLTFALLPNDASADLIKMFLMVGASNMHGKAEASDLSGPFSQPQDDVLIWQDDLASNVGWTSLRPGFGNSDNNFGSGGNSLRPGRGGTIRFGSELSLGRTLADSLTGSRVALLKHAEGGRDLQSDWNPNNLGTPDAAHMWSGLVAKSTAAISAMEADGHNVQVAGAFIYQGSKDARDLNGIEADNYQENLGIFVDAFRDQFGNPDMPIVLTQIPSTLDDIRYPRKQTIRDVQGALALNDPLIGIVQTEDLQFRSDDALHLASQGQLDLGVRYANQYLQITAVPEPAAFAILLPFVGMMGWRRRFVAADRT